jgi:indolepyruvate ferredoxin oxidoreductase beta subunit
VEDLRVVVAGLGGQGVIFLTRLLARAALLAGRPVMVSENHGMSQRGGSVLAHLSLGPGQAPLIRRGTADLLLALDGDEATRNLPYLRPGGALVMDGEGGPRSEVRPLLERLGITILALPASRLAAEMGYPAGSNVLIAGCALALPRVGLDIEFLRQVVGSGGRPKSRAANLAAVNAGYEAGRAFLAERPVALTGAGVE